MSPVVECCMNNLTPSGQKVLDESNCDVRFSFCLDRCGRCHEEPFLVIDGEPISGASYDEVVATSGKAEEE